MKKNFLSAIILFFIVSNAWAKKPIITFFNEMNGRDLVNMFDDSTIITTLKKMNAEIRMGMVDLSFDRAEVVKKLNQAGIPVVAWILLPENEGYWFNSSNGLQALKRYRDLQQWAAFNDLEFKAIGIDLELDINDAKLVRDNPLNLFWMIPPRLYSKAEYEKGQREYTQLIETIQQDGYIVESYYAPFIKDETSIGNTAIQQATKFLDIKTNKEIPMLYSSFLGNPDGYYKIYGSDLGLKAVGVGSTGGGVDTTLPTLTYQELVHDISVASKFADEVHVFSLEGCVQKGYLTRLSEQQFNSKIELDQVQIQSVQQVQKYVKFVSTILSYPTLLILSVVLIITGIIWLMIFTIKKVIFKMRNVSSI